MAKIKFSGREGVIVFLAVAVFAGLAVGSGALDFGGLLARVKPTAPTPGKVAASSASAVAGATHG